MFKVPKTQILPEIYFDRIDDVAPCKQKMVDQSTFECPKEMWS